jgi:hypothetical protein
MTVTVWPLRLISRSPPQRSAMAINRPGFDFPLAPSRRRFRRTSG